MARIYTVAEALALPPPTAELIEQRRLAAAQFSAVAQSILDRRGGVPYSDEEFQEFLHEGEYDWLDNHESAPATTVK